MKTYSLIKSIWFVLYLQLISFYCLSQTPGVEWDKTFGGNDYDNLYELQQTSDGGYILAGYSYSDISGNKSEDSWAYDYWVLKINGSGVIEWQNTIGGNGNDYLESATQTFDGGYILGGYSASQISGDKSEASLGYFVPDYWVIKLNSSGTIEWQNTIGGLEAESLKCIIQTVDGGYIIGGRSESGISGDKTENSLGGSDYWIIKLNNFGGIEWQNTIGGAANDQLTSIEQTSDGGYIVGGYSLSGISGDKTEPNLGADDYWVIKLNSSGAVEWQNTIGGAGNDYLFCVIQTNDEGYILAGNSNSGIGFDKTEITLGDLDYWVIKLNNIGEIEWQNTIGGTSYDNLQSVFQTLDNGYILGGHSSSDISGDKTENSALTDWWVLKLNETGDIVWQNSLGGNGNDYLLSVRQTSDFGFISGGYSYSGISGDKTQNSFGFQDYWVVKIMPECTPTPELCNSLDDNCNGLIDDAITETISISAGGPTTFCQGGNVLLTATYSGATVQWKKNGVNIPGATSPTYLVTTKATYTCETTSPCDTELSTGIFVNVLKNPPASITAGGATTFCAGGSVILTANAGGGLSYQWYKGASLIAGATSINYTATLAGNYKCRVTKTATGCFKNSNVISVSVPCKEGELLHDEDAFTIYPNPNDGTFTIQANLMTQDFASPESKIEIYNNLGQLIYSKEINSHDGIINELIEMDYIISGIYLIKLLNNNKQYESNIIIE